MAAVLASADSATEKPCRAVPIALVPTSFDPTCVHTPPLWVNIQTAPVSALSAKPPTSAALPSADNAPAEPCSAAPPLPLPRSFDPCWLHVAPLLTKTQAAPLSVLSP